MSLEDIQVNIKRFNIIPIFLTLSTIGTVNFMSYIYRFDFKVLLLLDFMSISKHIIHFVILFSFSIAFVSIFFLFLKYLIPICTNKKESKDVKFFTRIRFFLCTLDYLKYIFGTIVFLFFYVGISKLFDVILLSIGLFILSIGYLFLSLLTQREQINIKNIITNYGVNIVIINIVTISFYIGAVRASYIKESVPVSVNSNKSKDERLFISTANAIGLYNVSTKKIRFVSWGQIQNLEFLIESK